MAYLSEGSKVGGKQIETVEGAQAKANQARDSAVDTVLRWAKDLGLGTKAKAIQNWDELEQTGFYNGNGNGPLGSVVFGIHVQHSSNYGLQVVGRHNRLFIRTRENDIWNDWRELESVDKVESKLNELKNELTSLIDDTKNQLQSKVSRTEFESLQIGGRNLLLNSSKEFRIANHGLWYATIATIHDLAEIGLKAGDTVTFSVYVRTGPDGGAMARLRWEDGETGVASDYGTSLPENSEGRLQVTGVVPHNATRLSLVLNNVNNPEPYQSEYKEAKLEKGNKATDWTPAPEDIFQEITNVKNSSAPISHVGSGGNAHALATPSAHGFMSSSDKAKLDGIQAGAEVNQNTFSTIKVGSTNVVADSKTDTLELVAGTNVVLTPDATNDRITIGLSSNVETVSGAQAKVDAHANRKDNPHNVTSEQISKTTEKSADVPGTSYPKGYSYFSTANGRSLGYPANLAVIQTIHDSEHRVTQYITDNSDSTNMRKWYRIYRSDMGWSEFTEIETTTGAQAKVNAHANRTDNPHNVTKAQVGLGNVANYSIATQAEAEAGITNEKYMTPLRTMQLLNKKIHVGSSPPSNPRQGDLWIW